MLNLDMLTTMETFTPYLVLFRFCLLSVLPQSPVFSSLATESVDWSEDVSNSPSPSLEFALWRALDTGAGEEERGGRGKFASLIVEDIHSIPMLRIDYLRGG
jgi:hypothetical protein